MKPTTNTLFKLCAALGSWSFAPLASAAGVATITYGPGGIPVPTMSGTMLIALAVVLALFAFRLLKDRLRSGSSLVIAIAAITALASGAGGIKLISSADAVAATLDMSSVSGGTIVIPSSGLWVISNSTDVAQTIRAITYGPDCGPGMIRPPLEALVVNGAEPVNTCSTGTTLAPGATESCEISVSCLADET